MLIVTYNITGGVSIFDPFPIFFNIMQGPQDFRVTFNIVPDLSVAYKATPQIVSGGAS
jgi:hypothetical protein